MSLSLPPSLPWPAQLCVAYNQVVHKKHSRYAPREHGNIVDLNDDAAVALQSPRLSLPYPSGICVLNFGHRSWKTEKKCAHNYFKLSTVFNLMNYVLYYIM